MLIIVSIVLSSHKAISGSFGRITSKTLEGLSDRWSQARQIVAYDHFLGIIVLGNHCNRHR